MKFQDTKLLQHRTVEKAFNVLPNLFNTSRDEDVKSVIEVAEILSTRATHPDPDAVAALVILGGIFVRFKPEFFAEKVSPAVGALVGTFYDLDPVKDVSAATHSEAARQMMLAYSIVGLEGLREELAGKDWKDWNGYDYKNRMDVLVANEAVLKAVSPLTSERLLFAAADAKLAECQMLLEDNKRTQRAALAFEKSGLPDHPTIREAYERVKEDIFEINPLSNWLVHRSKEALIIAGTKLSTDPDVIAAALFDQLYDKPGKKVGEGMPPRVRELYLATSPMAHVKEKFNANNKEDTRVIRQAARLAAIENVSSYLPRSMDEMSKSGQYSQLDMLRKLTEALESGIKPQDPDAFKQRAEKAITAARIIFEDTAAKKLLSAPPPEMDW